MNLTTKFTLTFSGIILFMGYISFYGIYSFQYEILEQEITEKLENAAESHLDKLDRMFYERLSDLDILSENPVFQSTARTSAIGRELEKFHEKYPQYMSITYFNMDRVVVAHAGKGSHAYTRHPLTEYWPDIYAGKSRVVNISSSASLHVPTLHFAIRVKGQGDKTLGVLVARIPISELYALMESASNTELNNPKYDMDILDKDGLILYSNHNSESVLQAVDEDFGLIKAALPGVRSVDSLTEVHQEAHSGETKVLMVFAKEQGYRSFRGNDWILKVMHPFDEAFAPVSGLSRRIFIFLLSISVVGIAAILAILGYTVVRPIKRLNRATTQLGEGRLDTRVAVESPDEIGRLAQSFNVMASNLKEARKQLAHAAETALARARLAERKIIEISEETQQQIGRELHDDLGQQLTGIAFMSEVMRQHLKSDQHPEADTAARVTSLINEAITKAHNLAHDLHPVEMKETGLSAMLMRLAANTQSIYGINCTCECEGEPRIDTPLTNTNLFRIVQEAVHNAVKHSGASRIIIRMIVTPEDMVLEVEDNGRGIDAQSGQQPRGGLGMHTMQYRASLLNAKLEISETPGGGTRVVITLPAGTVTI